LSTTAAQAIPSRAIRFTPSSGRVGNHIETNSYASTIAAGWYGAIESDAWHSFIGGGSGNVIRNERTSQPSAPGRGTNIDTNAHYSFIGGGGGNYVGYQFLHFRDCRRMAQRNRIGRVAFVIGGGANSHIEPDMHGDLSSAWKPKSGAARIRVFKYCGWRVASHRTNAHYSFIGGGGWNSIQDNSSFSFIGGGANGHIESDAWHSFIGGGNWNQVQSGSDIQRSRVERSPHRDQRFITHSLVEEPTATLNRMHGDLSSAGETKIWCRADPSIQVLWVASGIAIGTNAHYSFIGGGSGNWIYDNSHFFVHRRRGQQPH